MATSNKTVFVTTGATIPFKELIEACLDSSILETLFNLGFTSLVIQYGQASADLVDKCNSATRKGGITVSGFSLKPSLNEDIKSSDLVISHAGMLNMVALYT